MVSEILVFIIYRVLCITRFICFMQMYWPEYDTNQVFITPGKHTLCPVSMYISAWLSVSCVFRLVHLTVYNLQMLYNIYICFYLFGIGSMSCVFDWFPLDSVHTWEDTKVTIWTLCVSIHRQIPYIPPHLICHCLLCLHKSLSGWWALIPGCFCCQVFLPFTLDCPPSQPLLFSYISPSPVLHVLLLLNGFLPDSLL